MHDTQVIDKQGFESEATTVLSELRAALSAVLNERTNGGAAVRIDRASDVCRAFGVDRTLGWRVFRIVHAPNPLESGAFVPRRTPLEGFLAAAAQTGVPDEVLEPARSAFERFEDLVRRHAGDRKTFDSMIAQWSGAASDRMDVTQRRASFRAHRHLVGLTAKADLGAYIFHPSAEEPDCIDLASIRGWIDLRRLRPFARFALAEYNLQTPDNTDAKRYGISLGPDGSPLLPEFSTARPDDLTTTRTSTGRLIAELAGAGVGNGSAATYFLGQVRRGISDPANHPSEPWIRTRQRVRVPSELMVMDCLLPRSMYGRLHPRCTVWWDALQGGLGQTDPDWREYAAKLDVFEPRWLGTGPAVLHVGRSPQYARCVARTCELLGWDIDAFDVYRCEIEYPLVNSIPEMRFDLAG